MPRPPNPLLPVLLAVSKVRAHLAAMGARGVSKGGKQVEGRDAVRTYILISSLLVDLAQKNPEIREVLRANMDRFYRLATDPEDFSDRTLCEAIAGMFNADPETLRTAWKRAKARRKV